MYRAACSSASPPISPISTIASVCGSSWNALRQSMWVVPTTGSPPIPTQVENPMSRSSYIIWYVSVPDFDTRPMRPDLVMSAGMMPAFDRPGLIRPGQFGPMIRVAPPERCACAQNTAVSCTGMPSVITTQSGSRASTVSTTAALANRAGTKTTATSAPVAATASATRSNTGMPSTSWPPLPGVTPATMRVPEATIRRVCRRPSAPVMPCTSTRDDSSRKIAISSGPLPARAGRRQLGRPVRGTVHGVHLLHAGQAGVGQDAPALLGVVAVQPHHQWQRHRLAARVEQPERLHDAVGYLVAGGDPAEDVHEHTAHRRVGQDDLQPVRHHLGRGAAADVQEVRRPHPAVPLAGVRHHVQGGHHQAGAVADDADLPVQLDVVQIPFLGLL